MVDRDVVHPPLEIVHRVSPVAHHLGDQHVGLTGGAVRVVDELALRCPPCLLVACPGTRVERDDLELTATLLPLGELRFRTADVALPGDRAPVLRPEPLPQSLRAASLRERHRQEHENYDRNYDRDGQTSVHGRSFHQTDLGPTAMFWRLPSDRNGKRPPAGRVLPAPATGRRLPCRRCAVVRGPPRCKL